MNRTDIENEVVRRYQAGDIAGWRAQGRALYRFDLSIDQSGDSWRGAFGATVYVFCVCDPATGAKGEGWYIEEEPERRIYYRPEELVETVVLMLKAKAALKRLGVA